MASLSEKAALLMAANLLKYAVGFALPMVLVRMLSQEDYGTYQQLTLVSNFALGLLALGIPTSVFYFYASVRDTPTGRATLIAQTQVMLAVCGLAAAALIALGAPFLSVSMHNARLAELLPYIGLYVGFMLLGEHFLNVMISQNRYGLAVGLETVETALRVTVVLLPLFFGFGLEGLALALAGYALARFALRSFWLWRGPDSIARAVWTERFPAQQLAYSLPLAASSCVGLVGGMLDRAIVALSFTPAAYAIYSVGALEIPIDVIFQASVANVLRATLPGLIREGQMEEIVRIWRESVRKLAIIVVPSFIFLSCFATEFITTLFTDRYVESVEVFRIYLLLVPLHMFVFSSIPQAFGKTRLNLYVVTAVTLVNVGLCLVLLRTIGILGPAVAFASSAYVGAAIYFVATTRLLKAGPARLLPLGQIVRTAVAAGVSLIPALLAASAVGSGLLGLIAAGAAFSITFAAAGFFLRVFVEQDIKLARAWLRRLSPAGQI